MRTTLTVDDDLNEKLLQIARDTRQPFKTVLNDALRRGLSDHAPAGLPFDYTPHPGQLRAGIDPRRLNELAWQLDEEEFRHQ